MFYEGWLIENNEPSSYSPVICVTDSTDLQSAVDTLNAGNDNLFIGDITESKFYSKILISKEVTESLILDACSNKFHEGVRLLERLSDGDLDCKTAISLWKSIVIKCRKDMEC